MAQPDLSGAREIRLSPAQDTALQGVLLGLERGRLVVLRDASSDGKTTVLNQVHAKMGGTRVGMPEFLSRIGLRLRAGVEDAFVEVVEEALADAELVLVDDLNRARDIAENGNNPKAGLFDAALAVILEKAVHQEKKLLFATDGAPVPLMHRAHTWVIEDLQASDYKAIWSAYLDDAVLRRMNFAEIHQFAPSLNANQLRKAAEWLAHDPAADTARALDYLSEHNLESNVETAGVEAVELQDLKGVDDVIRELEAKVALSLGDRTRAAKLNLKPKRGVLLAGPPEPAKLRLAVRWPTG